MVEILNYNIYYALFSILLLLYPGPNTSILLSTNINSLMIFSSPQNEHCN